VKQRQQDAEQGVLRVDAVGTAGRIFGGVAVEQACHGQRDLEAVAQIVVKGVATQQPRVFAAVGLRRVGYRRVQEVDVVAPGVFAIENCAHRRFYRLRICQVDLAGRIELRPARCRVS